MKSKDTWLGKAEAASLSLSVELHAYDQLIK